MLTIMLTVARVSALRLQSGCAWKIADEGERVCVGGSTWPCVVVCLSLLISYDAYTHTRTHTCTHTTHTCTHRRTATRAVDMQRQTGCSLDLNILSPRFSRPSFAISSFHTHTCTRTHTHTHVCVVADSLLSHPVYPSGQRHCAQAEQEAAGQPW